MSTFSLALGGIVGLLVLVGVGFLVRDVFAKMSGSGVILLLGLFVLFIGERVLGEGDWRMPVSGVGLVVVLGALGLRAYAWSNSTGARREGHQQALVWTAVVVGSLLLYALTLDPITGALGFEEDAAARWVGVWRSLFPIVTLVGLVPVFMLDRLLAVHPVMMPTGASRSAQLSGVAAALGIALVFPVNYLADQHDVEWDVAYFRTTKPGTSTKAIAQTSAEPIEAILFFPAGNDVGREVLPYFEELARDSSGQLTVKMVDQALDPVLAEELKVRENGQIVLRQGETDQKFKLNIELDRAKRELRKLDSTVQKHLLKLTRGQRTVYFLVGHGEAHWRESDDPLRKLNVYKRDVLEAQNFKVKTFGAADGSTNAVPDDADVVIVAGPTDPLLAEEIEVLKTWFDQGGSLVVLVDPKGDPMTGLLDHLGVQAGSAVLANAEAHARLQGGPADRVLIATNKYGSHASVKTLSRNSQVAPSIYPGAVSIVKKDDTPNKVTTLVRSMPNTWEDANANFQNDPDEEKKVFEIAVAIEKDVKVGDEKKDARAIVIGDVNFLADDLLKSVRANAQLGFDGVRWASRDEDISGEVESEEDTKVQHTREEDWVWFLTTIVAVPGLVLLFGVIFIRLRQRRS